MGRAVSAAILAALVGVSFATPLILWSSSEPVVIAFYRLGLATLVLLPFLAVHRGGTYRWTLADVGWLVLVGAILAAHFVAWITSLRLIDAAPSVILVTSHPLLVALISHFAFRERVTRLMAYGIGTGLVGLVVIGADTLRGASLLGNGLAFAGGVFAGLYLLAGRRLRQRIPLMAYAVAVYASTTVALGLFALVSGVSLVPSGNVGREFALFLALALVAQIGGHTLYNWSLRYVTAPVVSLSLLGEPIGASLLALAFFGQMPSAFVFVGGALVLGGVYLTMRGGLAAERAAPEGAP
jgi:drug/metabolite transporter (DMT)-like permease